MFEMTELTNDYNEIENMVADLLGIEKDGKSKNWPNLFDLKIDKGNKYGKKAIGFEFKIFVTPDYTPTFDGYFNDFEFRVFEGTGVCQYDKSWQERILKELKPNDACKYKNRLISYNIRAMLKKEKARLFGVSASELREEIETG